MTEPTVTISVAEYDSLRVAKAALESKHEFFLRFDDYGCRFISNSKDEWIQAVFKELKDCYQTREQWRVKLRLYEQKYGELK